MVQVVHATIPVAPAQVGATEWAEAHTVTGLDVASVDGLQAALEGKSDTNHTHAGVYEPAGAAATAITAHEAASNPHPGYLTPAEGDAAYATLGHNHTGVYEVSGAVATHAALTTVHGISAFGATLVDDADQATARSTLGLGTAATTAATDYATAGHTHAGVYEPADATILKDADIGVTVAAQGHNHTGTYDPAGTAASAISDHEAAANPHPTYLTQAEGDGLYAASGHTHASYLTDAPSDGNEYVRKNGAWAIETDSGGSATDLSYTAATRVLASSTGADATLPLVTSSDAGLAPASGGGTANFLRADGTWAAPPAGSYTLVATLASDQATGANTTPVTLTGLSFSYEANSKYRIWAMGRVAPTAATTGCGFQFDLSSAVTSIDVLFFHQLANTGTLSGGHSIADDASVGVSSGMPGTSTYPVTVHGLLITTSNTGTAQLRFRSETTAVTTCKAGFTLVVEKIA